MMNNIFNTCVILSVSTHETIHFWYFKLNLRLQVKNLARHSAGSFLQLGSAGAFIPHHIEYMYEGCPESFETVSVSQSHLYALQ